MQLAFGSGAHWAVPSVANPTPVRMGVAQNMSVDFSQATKPLHGTNRLPVEIAASEMTVKGKTTLAQLSGRLQSDIVFSETLSTGVTLYADRENGTVPATPGPYTITVANAATFTRDLGVIYASGTKVGQSLVRVASAPATGQYSLAAGVYTFASADQGLSVKLSYNYTAASGNTVTLLNQPMGQASRFASVMGLTYAGLQSTLTLNACVVTKKSFATNISDWTKPDFEFDACTDTSDTLGAWSFAEAT